MSNTGLVDWQTGDSPIRKSVESEDRDCEGVDRGRRRQEGDDVHAESCADHVRHFHRRRVEHDRVRSCRHRQHERVGTRQGC